MKMLVLSVVLICFPNIANAALNSEDQAKVQALITKFETLFNNSQAETGGQTYFYKRNIYGADKRCLTTADYSILTNAERQICKLDALDMYQRAPAMDALIDMYLIVKKLEETGGFTITIPSSHYIHHAINMANTYFKSYENYKATHFEYSEFKEWQGQPSIAQGKDFNYELRSASGIARLLLVAATGDVPESAYLQSYSLVKQVYHHVWRKWTESNFTNIKNIDALGTDIFARSGLVALSLAAWSDSEKYGITNGLGLPKHEFIQYLENKLPNMLRQPTNEDYYLIFVRMNATTNYCKRDGWCDGAFTGEQVEHPGSIYDIGHARDIILLSTLLEHRFSTLENYSYLNINNDVSTHRLFQTLKNDVWEGGIQFRDWPVVRNVNHIREFNLSTETCHPDMNGYPCNMNFTNENFADWMKSEDLGSYQGAWAKLAKYDANLRQAYFNMIESGGVYCFGSQELRYGKATSFGSTSYKSSRCNKNTVLSQVQLVSSLLSAYINRVD